MDQEATSELHAISLHAISLGSPPQRKTKFCPNNLLLVYSPELPLHNASVQESRAEPHWIPKQSFWWPAYAAFFAGCVALLGSTESLWLDELHSSWAISGDWDQIVERARWGNQSPLYFWGLRLMENLLHGTVSRELPIRLPSILCWAATIGLVVNYFLRVESPLCGQDLPRGGGRKVWLSRGLVIIVALWLCLDRIQLFYATEARVYACLQWISLVNWLLIANLAVGVGEGRSRAPAANAWGLPLGQAIAWSVLSLLLVYLHATAALAVVWQWLFALAAMLLVKRADRLRRLTFWFGTGTGVALLSIPAWLWSQPVWERREQWRSFAGDASITSMFSLFPVLEFLVPIVIAIVVDRWMQSEHRTKSQNGRRSTGRLGKSLALRRSTSSDGANAGDRSLLLVKWLVALVGPCACAWIATWLEVAPLMHRRFVITSAIPLVMVAVSLWQTIQRPTLRLLSGLAVIIWLLVGQGTINAWRYGEIVGYQRAEGWREAVARISQFIEPEDEVYCASGLIEGRGRSLPLSEDWNHYLSFPLRGCYRIHEASPDHRPDPVALVNNVQRWAMQMPLRKNVDSSLDQAHRPVGNCWIVYRGTFEQLSRKLKQAGIEESQIVYPIVSFGRVSVTAVKM